MSIGLKYIDGFDTYITATGADWVVSSVTQVPWLRTGASNAAFIAGRYATITGSQALHLLAAPAPDDIRFYVNLGDASFSGAFGGAAGVSDGASLYCGMNIFIGQSTSGPVSRGFHRFVCWASGAPAAGTGTSGSVKVTVMING